MDLTGRILAMSKDDQYELNIKQTGVAFVSVIYADGNRVSKQVIITK